MPKTVSFITLGCKVNQYDSQAMLESFLEHGYQHTDDPYKADVCVINTCTVTGTGDKKSMQLIRRSIRMNPNGELIIAGCLAQRLGEKLLDTGARLIIGNQHRGEVVSLFEQSIRDNTRISAVESMVQVPYEPLHIHSHEGHTRAVMKIQEGCNRHCTYCIIPSVRGNIRSRSLDDIQAEASDLASAGFRELVLTGIHLTSYGYDLDHRPLLSDAVQAACVPGIQRIRLGSLEPGIAQESFIEALKNCGPLCPQFHLALQSGSDAVLRRMKRGYNTEQFMAAVRRIRKVWPLAAFTTDVIVGFPAKPKKNSRKHLLFAQMLDSHVYMCFPIAPGKEHRQPRCPNRSPSMLSQNVYSV